jgi:hypothetical protein
MEKFVILSFERRGRNCCRDLVKREDIYGSENGKKNNQFVNYNLCLLFCTAFILCTGATVINNFGQICDVT